MNKMRAIAKPSQFLLDQSVVKNLCTVPIYRPTIMAIMQTPNNELLMVLPKLAEPHGWIFPQGAIESKESPREAALRKCFEECGFTEDCFFRDQTVPILRGVIPRRSSKVDYDKEFFVVGLNMVSWKMPRLNDENSKAVLVHGPNDLWSHIHGCRPEKQTLIAACLAAAAFGGERVSFLRGRRWQSQRLQPFLKHVAT